MTSIGNESSAIGTICKIGRQEHMSSFLENGTVFMNTLGTFLEVEDGGVRGDPHEGVSEIQSGPHGRILTQSGEPIPATVGSWTLRMRSIQPKTVNVFCMYALRWDESAHPISPKLDEFGCTSVVFTNPNEFQRRLYQALRETGRSIQASLVEYVPDGHTGEMGLFRKNESFSWQSEWRVACFGGSGQALSIQLGSLEDIATSLPTANLRTYLDEIGVVQ